MTSGNEPDDRRVAKVAEPEVELDARERGPLPRDREHPGRRVDADDVDPRRRDRHREASRADAELDDRPSCAPRFLEVERHVLDDAPGPRIVEPRNLVVDGHAGMLPVVTTLARSCLFLPPRLEARASATTA